MASFNKVILCGNITRDLELRYTAGGTAVVDVGLAVNNRVKKGEDWVDEPMFIDVTLFGKRAETIAEYCGKGSPLLVEGRLKLEQWETDGQKRSKHVIVADSVEMLASRKDKEQEEPAPKKADNKKAAGGKANGKAKPQESSEDIPF